VPKPPDDQLFHTYAAPASWQSGAAVAVDVGADVGAVEVGALDVGAVLVGAVVGGAVVGAVLVGALVGAVVGAVVVGLGAGLDDRHFFACGCVSQKPTGFPPTAWAPSTPTNISNRMTGDA
jgi:hypothetical protein